MSQISKIMIRLLQNLKFITFILNVIEIRLQVKSSRACDSN